MQSLRAVRELLPERPDPAFEAHEQPRLPSRFAARQAQVQRLRPVRNDVPGHRHHGLSLTRVELTRVVISARFVYLGEYRDSVCCL